MSVVMFKYEAPIPFQTISHELPSTAPIRHVAMQGDRIYMWVEKRTAPADGAVVTRTFHTISTGVMVPEQLTWVGTVQDGDYMWHVFEDRSGL